MRNLVIFILPFILAVQSTVAREPRFEEDEEYYGFQDQNQNSFRSLRTIHRPYELVSTNPAAASTEDPSPAASLPKILKMIEDALKSKSASGPVNLNLIVVPLPQQDTPEEKAKDEDLETASSNTEVSIDSPASGIIPTQTTCRTDTEEYNEGLKICVPKKSVSAPRKGGGRRSTRPGQRHPLFG